MMRPSMIAREHAPAPSGHGVLLDADAVIRTCGEDEAIFLALRASFARYLPAQIAEVLSALEASDLARLRDAAHRLCSSLSAFSTRAGDAAAELEEMVTLGLEAVLPLVASLEEMSRRLLREVADLSFDTVCGLSARAATAAIGPTVR
jgi:HPt (histidine-containing phosphotransfer) domain-containing protein